MPRLPPLPNVIFDIFDMVLDSSMSISRADSSSVGAAGEIGGLTEGTRGIAGTGGTSFSCGNETAESLRSTGDLIAIMLVGETCVLSREIGDEGAEDTRPTTLSRGKTVIPHLLVGRTGAGVNSSGVIGETGSNGRGGGDSRIAASADPLRSGEEGRLSV